MGRRKYLIMVMIMQNCIKYIPNASGYWWEILKMQIEKRNRENIIKILLKM